MLAADPGVRTTVIRERLRAEGHGRGVTILEERLARIRLVFAAGRTWKRRHPGPATALSGDLTAQQARKLGSWRTRFRSPRDCSRGLLQVP
jgi:hypothetical protein